MGARIAVQRSARSTTPSAARRSAAAPASRPSRANTGPPASGSVACPFVCAVTMIAWLDVAAGLAALRADTEAPGVQDVLRALDRGTRGLA